MVEDTARKAPSAKDGEPAGGVQVIARAAQILRALEGQPRGLSLAQLADLVELPRSTVHRIVSALITEGFLASASPSGRVRIGPEFARLAWTGTAELWRAVETYMQRIHDQLGETVDCSILDGHRVRVIHVIPTRHELRAIADVGATFPLHSTSKGRAMLAAYDRAAARRMLPAELEQYTPKTVTTVDGVMKAIDEARRTGVAYDREESTMGICAAAIAVREPSGVLLAISVPVPVQRYTDLADKITRVLSDVRRDALAAFGDPAAG